MDEILKWIMQFKDQKKDILKKFTYVDLLHQWLLWCRLVTLNVAYDSLSGHCTHALWG